MPSNRSCCNKTVTLNASTLQFPAGNFLGWRIFNTATQTIVPASNVVVQDCTRIAVYVVGGNGQSTASNFNLIQFLGNSGVYTQVLVITYSTNLQGSLNASAEFVADQLAQLLPLKHLCVDLYGASNGSAMVRYAMEIRELGQYKQFQNVILITTYAEGLSINRDNINSVTSPEFYTAVSIQLGLITVIAANPLTYDNFLNTTGTGLSNPSFDTRFPGAGFNGVSFFRDLNQNQVPKKVFCNLKYYTVNGTNELATFIPAVPFPFTYRQLAGLTGVTDPALLAIADQLQAQYPSQGLLTQHIAALSPAAAPIITDGLVISRNEVLTTKSAFYRENPYQADLFIPANHSTVPTVTTPQRLQFWTNFINNLESCCNNANAVGTVPQIPALTINAKAFTQIDDINNLNPDTLKAIQETFGF